MIAQLSVLPEEVASIAKNVSVEKRNEVQSVLNQVFIGVSKMREQLDNVTVTDVNDKVNMKLANTIRLGVRQVRLDAEKTFDAKRAEVQQQMLSYKTEDQLWLKAKQTMQLLTKEIEENARWKEETKQRFEAEQKELRTEQRRLKICQFVDDFTTITTDDFSEISDDAFEMFLSGIEKAYNDKIEAEKKLEQERIEREKAEAQERLRIKAENERLKAEAEAKEKKFAEEMAKAEIERKLIEEKARKEKLEAEKKAKEELAKQEAILKSEREAKEKIEAELRAKTEAEERAKKEAEEKIIADKKAKEAEEKKAKAAPDKAKLIEFCKVINQLTVPEMKSDDGKIIAQNVKILLNKVTNYIQENSNKL